MGQFQDYGQAIFPWLGQLLNQTSLVYAQGNDGLTNSGEKGYASNTQSLQNLLQQAAMKEARRKEKEKKKKALPKRILGTAAQAGLSMTPAAPIAGAAGNAIAGSYGTYGGGFTKAMQPQPTGGNAPFMEGAMAGMPSAFNASDYSVAGAQNKAPVAWDGWGKRGY
jgi:hypothetical protein